MVLIDDDPLVRMAWKLAASFQQIPLKLFSSPDEWKAEYQKDPALFPKDTLFYIDSHLGAGIRGEEFAHELFHMGFRELYIETGNDPSLYSGLSWIRGVIGKTPPFLKSI